MLEEIYAFKIMLFLRNTCSIFFLFIFSVLFPTFLLKFLAYIVRQFPNETSITYLLTLLFNIFSIKLFFYFLDSKNKDKRWLDFTIPTQFNQLIPFALGLALGIPRGISQMYWFD